MPSEHAALAGPEALPYIGGGAGIDRPGDLIETQLAAGLRRRRGAATEALVGLRGAIEQIADRPLTAAWLALAGRAGA